MEEAPRIPSRTDENDGENSSSPLQELELIESWRRQRRQRIVLVWVALGALLGAFLWSQHRPSRALALDHQFIDIPTTLDIALQPFGDLPPVLLERQAELLGQRFHARVQVLEALPLPASSYDPDRGQYHAGRLLNLLFERQQAPVRVTVGVVAEDLYAEGWEYLYGLSQGEGRVAIYSLARTVVPMTFGLDGLEKGLEHADKVMLHELGHALQLAHCNDPRCVMNTNDRSPDLHKLSRFYCGRCQRRVLNPELYRSDSASARADGLYRRGSFDRAMVHYTVQLLTNPFDALAANRLGVSLAAKRQPLLARSCYRLAMSRDEQLAVPYYNMGLLYAQVEPSLSLFFLRAGFVRDPDRVEALGFLGTVFLRVYKDEAQALGFFERYVRAGGQSPAVLHHYRSMVYPVFDFAESEVAIIRGRAGACGLACRLQRLNWTLEVAQLAKAVDAPTNRADGPVLREH